LKGDEGGEDGHEAEESAEYYDDPSQQVERQRSKTVLRMQGNLAVRLVASFDRRKVQTFLHLMFRYPFAAEEGVLVNAGLKMDTEISMYVASVFMSWIVKKRTRAQHWLGGFNSVLWRMVQRFVLDDGVHDHDHITERIVILWESLVNIFSEEREKKRIGRRQFFCALAAHHWHLISITFSFLPLTGCPEKLPAVLQQPQRGAAESLRSLGIAPSELAIDFLVALPDIDESLPRLVHFLKLLENVLGAAETERWIVALCRRRSDWAAVFLRLCCHQSWGAHDFGLSKDIRSVVAQGLVFDVSSTPSEENVSWKHVSWNCGGAGSFSVVMRAIALALNRLDRALLLAATRAAANLLHANPTLMIDDGILFNTSIPVLIRQQRMVWSQLSDFLTTAEGGADAGAMVATTLALGVTLSQSLSRGQRRNHAHEWCEVVDGAVTDILKGALPFDVRGWPVGHAHDFVHRWGVVHEAFPSIAYLLWHKGGDRGKDEVRDLLSGSTVLRRLQRDASSTSTILGKRSHRSFLEAQKVAGEAAFPPLTVGGRPDELFALSSVFRQEEMMSGSAL
jgi:hypothetical protein